MGGNLYMIAVDASSGEQVWRTDGTSGGTVRSPNIDPRPGRVGPPAVVTMGGKLYFSAFDRAPRAGAVAEQRQHRHQACC